MRLTGRMACVVLFALAMLLAIGVPSCVQTPNPATRSDQRLAEWAAPIEKPGLPNLHKVSDDLYRGAQPPDAEGFRQLKAMGIKTVVDLRAGHSDREALGDTGLACEYIPMYAWHAEDEDVVAFLKIVTDKSRTPVFVHCLYGADRTGMMCAAYRIVVCGWSKDDAIREMTEHDFGFHKTWHNLVQYIRNMDVEKMKRKAGLSN